MDADSIEARLYARRASDTISMLTFVTRSAFWILNRCTVLRSQWYLRLIASQSSRLSNQSSDGTVVVGWLLYPEGTYQFLDGGRLDLGVVRDSTLDATNDYETFVETFESVAMRGLEAYQVLARFELIFIVESVVVIAAACCSFWSPRYGFPVSRTRHDGERSGPRRRRAGHSRSGGHETFVRCTIELPRGR